MRVEALLICAVVGALVVGSCKKVDPEQTRLVPLPGASGEVSVLVDRDTHCEYLAYHDGSTTSLTARWTYDGSYHVKGCAS